MDEPLRNAPDQATALAWSLALSSQGIPSQVAKSGSGWVVAVPRENARHAEEVLSDYDADQSEEAVRSTALHYGSTRVGVALAVAVAAFFLVTGPYDPARN